MITPRISDHDTEMLEDMALDLTPMLDIIFMLLVFLVLTTNVLQHAVEVTLPNGEAASVTAPENDEIVLTLHADSHWQIGEETFATWEDAREALAADLTQPETQRIVIAGDRAATLQGFAAALSFLRARGVTDINLLMEQE
jgi:biopolymer transport protein ExbD